ncbi:MAG: glycosyltransferase, partial [Candidatus Micrarchaeaceae archaeon]
MKTYYSDLTVIVPTLNEKGNIGRVINALIKLYPGIHIIVADDGSDDGTIEEVASFRSKNVVLLNRKNKSIHGLTASVVDAATGVNTKYTVVMDGDMQHPPELVRDLYIKLHSYDMVIGVRISVKNWGLHRVILSKGMAMLSYIVFAARRKPTTRDMMSGFFGIRTNVIKRIIKNRKSGFVMSGYKVMLDILRMAPPNLSLCEVEYSTFHT